MGSVNNVGKLVEDEVLKNTDNYIDFFVGGIDALRAWAQKMRRPGDWGDDVVPKIKRQ